MFRSPLTDYDTWACLTPGFLLLAAGDHVLRLGWIWRDTWTTVGAVFAIACAYVVGQACASLASLIIERGLVHRILKPPSVVLLDPDAGPKWAHRIFPNYYRSLPPPAPQRVYEKAEKAGVTQGSEALFQWAYHWQHEPCLYAVRKGATGHWQGARDQATLWAISNGGDEDAATVHGTQKPVECMRRPIINNSAAGEAIYDPFLGSGTTLIAAETTGRVCHAVDIDPRYVDVAIQRWQQMTKQAAVHAVEGRTFGDIAANRHIIA